MNYRILRFTAENFKKIVAIDITPTGDVVQLTGKNRQGKTSVLDAIWAVLKGSKFSRETSQTIRDGQDHAWVRLEIGEDANNIAFIATRRWTKEDAGTLTVEAVDGAKYGSPQKFLDDIVGEISFDPLQFIDLDGAKQVDALVNALGAALPFNPATLAMERKGVYDRRTEISRKVKDLEGQLTGYAPVDPSLPESQIPAAEVLAKFEAAREHNTKLQRAGDVAVELQRHIDAIDRTTDDLERKLKEAQAERVTVEARRQDAYADSQAAEPINLDGISAELAGLEETNTKIRAQLHRAAVAAELADRKSDVAQCTIALNAIDKKKADGIAAAKFPVPELSFDDNGVTYNGRAFSQASTEEQMRASFGVAIVANPSLRVCRIDKGEALDSDSQRVLAGLAAEHDMQVWISRVDESGTVGFVIEEGQVAA